MEQKTVYKEIDGKVVEMPYNPAPDALEALESSGWSEKKPRKQRKPKGETE